MIGCAMCLNSAAGMAHVRRAVTQADKRCPMPPATIVCPAGCDSLASKWSAILLRCETSATLVSMDKRITQRQLRNDSAAVLREVRAGQTVIVTRNGEPVAELRPVPPRRFVSRSVIEDAARRAARIDADRLRTDLDSAVDQSTHG